jgi:hypothetical protein
MSDACCHAPGELLCSCIERAGHAPFGATAQSAVTLPGHLCNYGCKVSRAKRSWSSITPARRRAEAAQDRHFGKLVLAV